MKMEITGKRYGTFTNDKGLIVAFRTLYVKSPLKSIEGAVSEGYTSEKIGVTRCVSDTDMELLKIGDTIDVTFNQYGNAEGVEIC